MAEPVRVVVVDDQPLFASGLRMQIDATDDIRCVGVARNGQEGILLVQRERPDVVLMDLRMPVLDGLAATAELRGGGDSAPHIVVLTTIRRDEAVYAALRAGATSFLTKDATPEVLLATIRAAAAGESASDPRELMAEFGGSPVESEEGPLIALSPREREIFLLVARGLNNREIAQAAFVTEATVKSHVRALLAKLDLRTRVQGIVFAHEKGLVRS